MLKIVTCCSLIFAFGCSNVPPADSPDGDRSGVVRGDLVTSLEVEVGTDTARFVLHLTNSGTQPAALEFNTSARYDFAVQAQGGTEIWRYSTDKMFAQVLGTETIEAGDTRRYTASWRHGGRTGSYVALGKVLATNRNIEQRTQFEIRQR